jgi:hypothetical protein
MMAYGNTLEIFKNLFGEKIEEYWDRLLELHKSFGENS